MTRRIGLLGGTFDPIHRGHVDLALACAREVGLDAIWLVPAATPPHKAAAAAGTHHRFAMVALAASGHAGLVPDPRELERSQGPRQGPSYTIDTLEEIRGQSPDADLHLLVGGDSLRDFTTWRRWQDILGLATLVATGRSGVDLDAAVAASHAIPPERLKVVRHEPPPWSSRELRARLGSGDSCLDALEPAVSAYIHACGLYGTHPSGTETPQ